jgi:hypothetical protein
MAGASGVRGVGAGAAAVVAPICHQQQQTAEAAQMMLLVSELKHLEAKGRS